MLTRTQSKYALKTAMELHERKLATLNMMNFVSWRREQEAQAEDHMEAVRNHRAGYAPSKLTVNIEKLRKMITVNVRVFLNSQSPADSIYNVMCAIDPSHLVKCVTYCESRQYEYTLHFTDDADMVEFRMRFL